MSKNFAPGKDQQIDPRKIHRNQKGFGHKLAVFLASKKNCLAILVSAALLPLLIPQIFDVCRIIILCEFTFFLLYNRKPKPPINFPAYSPLKNWNHIDAKTGKPDEPKGIMYVGNDNDGNELWIDATDMKTHMMIFGSTGSGKTVSLLSLALNSISILSGLCYIDPKGDTDLAHTIFNMARRVNRDDDFLVLDFMTGDQPSVEYTPFRISNTMNPFAFSSAPTICNLLNSLLSDSSDNKIFQEKATMLLDALMPILCELRDANVTLPLTDMSQTPWNKKKGELGSGLNINMIASYIDAYACAALVYPVKGQNIMRRGQQSAIGGQSDADEECDAIAKIVAPSKLAVLRNTLAGLNYVNGNESPEKQRAYGEQFGYAQSYYGRTMTSFSGMYRHIFGASNGEISMDDVLFNRRIMVTILPSMEKSKTECENLGKVVLASIKNSTAPGLGNKLEGTTTKIRSEKPSSSRTPAIIVVDEYAAVMMEGFEIMLTQARSLGFMVIIATQDLSGMKEKDAKSCGQILENTTIKLFMKMVNAGDTWEYAKKLFGEVSVEEKDLQNPEKHGPIKQKDKISQIDLMKQRYGQFHAFYNGDLIYGSTQMMDIEVDSNTHMRVPHFIRTNYAKSLILDNLEIERLETEQKFGEEENAAWLHRIRETCGIPEICALEVYQEAA